MNGLRAERTCYVVFLLHFYSMKHFFYPSVIGVILLALTLSSCGTSRKATNDSTGTQQVTSSVFSASDYLNRVVQGRSAETNLTAKIHVEIQMGDKSVSTSGTLRMKRDDVIQISVVDPILGVAELGRAEFTQNRVLFLDRINKRYIDVPYSEVSFLQRADVDFNTLQSLFWNEVFQPGQTTLNAAAFTFSNAQGQQPRSNENVNIEYKGSLLQYCFQTAQPLAQLRRTRISSMRDKEGQFSFDYSAFKNFEGKDFPHEMVMQFVMGKQRASLSFSLSSLRNNSDWQTRTQVPSRYTKADAEKIIRSLIR